MERVKFKSMQIFILAAMVVFSMSPKIVFAEDSEVEEIKARENLVVGSIDDLVPVPVFAHASLQSLGFTEDDLISAGKNTVLEGMLNSDGSVPAYRLVNVVNIRSDQTTRALVGKLMLYVEVDNPPQSAPFLYFGSRTGGRYSVKVIDQVFVLDEGKFITLSDFFDKVGETRYGRFLSLDFDVDAKPEFYGSDLKGAVVSANRSSIMDFAGSYYPSYDYNRLLSFEESVFRNIETEEVSELYAIYVWTVAGLLFYEFIGKRAIGFFSFRREDVRIK